jgi:hypothetical protein
VIDTSLQVTDEDREQLSRGANDLKETLSKEANAEQAILDAIGRTVAVDPGANTLGEGADRLRSLVSEDATRLIIWTMSTDTDQRLAWVEEHCDPSAVAFLRKLGGLYGPELRQSYKVWNELPEGWSNIFREVFFDLVTQQYRIRLRITKYSGDEVVFEGSPDSILDLATHMLVTLNYLPSKDVFRESLADAFLAQATELVERLRDLPQEPTPATVMSAETS